MLKDDTDEKPNSRQQAPGYKAPQHDVLSEIPPVIGCVGIKDDGLKELIGIIFHLHGNTGDNLSAKMAISRYDEKNLIPAAGIVEKWGSDAGILNAFSALSRFVPLSPSAIVHMKYPLPVSIVFKLIQRRPKAYSRWNPFGISPAEVNKSQRLIIQPTLINDNHWILCLFVFGCGIHPDGCCALWDPMGMSSQNKSRLARGFCKVARRWSPKVTKEDLLEIYA